MRPLAAGLILALMVPQTAVAGPGKSKKPSEEPELGQLSQQGTRRGGVEIGIGVVLTGAAIGLIAFGTVQLIRAREHIAFCNQGGGGGGIDPCVFDPPPLGFASAGLSWGFSIPLLVGGGLLFARAKRIRVDAREYQRMQMSFLPGYRAAITLTPWGRREGGGASLSLRF